MKPLDRVELIALLYAHDEGALSIEKAERVLQLLHENDQARLLYIQHQQVTSSLCYYALQSSIQNEKSALESWVNAPDADAGIQALIENANLQNNGLTQPFRLSSQSQDHHHAITPRQLLSLAGYLLGQALTTKLAYKAYGIAAAILVALTLFLVFGGEDDTATDPLAGQTPTSDAQPDQPSVYASPIVATLTDERHAVWDRRPGYDLLAGQRFTLTRGFAEITTARGAVAVLEAPATIELTNNNNALRLHAGRLVGICETESSKGFVVRSPQMDITDIGTRFGVNTSAIATEVHVFDGKVQAERVGAAADDQPVTLVANQSARASADTDLITRIDHDANRFVALLPTTIQLPGTGRGLAIGDTDPNWQVVEVDGQTLATPLVPTVYKQMGQYHILDPDPATSQWIGVDTTNETTASANAKERGIKPYVFQTQVLLPESFDANNTELLLRFHADNKLTALRINGRSVQIPDNDLGDRRDELHAVRVEAYVVPGSNTIRFEVRDGQPSVQEAGPKPINFVGLLVAWEVKQLTASPGDDRQP